MKVLLFIDSLGSGGAQRQIILLANGLSELGHEVTILTYYDINHYKSICNEQYSIICIPKGGRFGFLFLFKILKFLKEKKFQVIISYLFVPSFYVLILKYFLKGNVKLIVSERTFEEAMNFFQRKVIRGLYIKAGYIVANSKRQADILLSKLSSLQMRIRFIPNGLDLNDFYFVNKVKSEIPLFLGIGSVYTIKNIIFLIEALKILKERGIDFKFSWVGKFNMTDPYFIECNNKIMTYNLEENWTWEGELEDVSKFYISSDFLVLTSIGEGFPNVICESLACGTPVIASAVCDHPYYVKDNVNGYTFDIDNPTNLVNKLIEAIGLSSAQYQDMRKAANLTAINNFSKDKLVFEYNKLISNDN